MMAPKPKSPKLPRLVVLLGSAIPVAAAFAGVARATKTTIDSFATKAAVESTYVRRDSLEIRHQRDSLNTNAALTAIQKDVGALVRACIRRRECQ